MTRYSDGTYAVRVGPEAKSSSVSHEMAHVLEGEDPIDPGEGSVRKHTSTGLSRFLGDSEGATELDEVVTDFIASALENGHADVTDPKSVYRNDISYLGGLHLLHALCTTGEQPIDVCLFIAAQLEDTEVQQRDYANSAAFQLIFELEMAFPGRNIQELVKQIDHKNGRGVDAFRLAGALRSAKLERDRATTHLVHQ